MSDIWISIFSAQHPLKAQSFLYIISPPFWCVFVILNTELTHELIIEGIARELVRKIQSLRKDADLVITDRINVYYDGEELIEETINVHEEFIKNETLADALIKQSNVSEKFEMNETTAELKIEKI